MICSHLLKVVFKILFFPLNLFVVFVKRCLELRDAVSDTEPRFVLWETNRNVHPGHDKLTLISKKSRGQVMEA